MWSSEGKEFGELLGQFRTEAKLTQQQLANLMGKARGTIVNWENGTHLPKQRALVLELAKRLHLDSLKRDQLLEAALFEPLGTIWTIPFQRNPFFTGREDILNYLQKALSTDKTVALMQPRALKGLGGIGKTHTAIEYAYRHRDEYQAILWAPATTSSILQASLVSIATILNLPEKNEQDQDVIVKAVKQWLMNHSGWLLILDNVEDLESVGMLYPWAHSGQVIITTRSQSVGGIALSITLEKMEPAEGALFLLRRAALLGPEEGKEQATGTDYEKAQKLSEVLGGLPLALDQAAAYIEKTRCSFSAYLELYQTQKAKLLSERGSLTTDHPESVTVTFFLAFQKVENASIAAAELLQLCAFLSPDAIPEEIIINGAAQLGPALETIATDPIEFNTTIGILLSYSLVRRDTDIETRTQVLSVHRLVQAVLQDTMATEAKKQWVQRAVQAVNTAFPHVEYSKWQQCQRLLPHVLACEGHIGQWSFTFLEEGRLLQEAGDYLRQRAQYIEALPFLERSLAIREQGVGPNHSDVAITLNSLAVLYFDQGQYTESEPLLQRALMIDEQELGPDHPHIAFILNNLALLYEDQGRFAEAASMLQRALAIFEQKLGPDHPNTAAILNNLSNIYQAQGKFAEALSLLQQALEIKEQKLGPDHLDLSYSLNNVAEVYLAQGQYTKAEPLYQRALQIKEQALGPNHLDVALVLSNLAELYLAQERYQEALPLSQRALAIREQMSKPDHPDPDLAISLNNLALLYQAQGQIQEALPLLQRALAIREQAFGPDHPDVASSLNNLALLYQAQEQYQEALPLLQRALAIFEQKLGPDHPDMASSLNNLALLYQAQGQFQEALPLLKQALAIREQAFGPDHPDVVISLNNLALLYQAPVKGRFFGHLSR